MLLYCDMINVHNNDFNVYKDNELQQHHEEKDIDNETAWTKEYKYCPEEVPP